MENNIKMTKFSSTESPTSTVLFLNWMYITKMNLQSTNIVSADICVFFLTVQHTCLASIVSQVEVNTMVKK